MRVLVLLGAGLGLFGIGDGLLIRVVGSVWTILVSIISDVVSKLLPDSLLSSIEGLSPVLSSIVLLALLPSEWLLGLSLLWINELLGESLPCSDSKLSVLLGLKFLPEETAMNRRVVSRDTAITAMSDNSILRMRATLIPPF